MYLQLENFVTTVCFHRSSRDVQASLPGGPYLFQAAALFLLLLDAFLPIVQQLPLVFLGVSALSGQLSLLPLVSLRALLVLLLQALEVPPQGGLAGHVEDRTDDEGTKI